MLHCRLNTWHSQYRGNNDEILQSIYLEYINYNTETIKRNIMNQLIASSKCINQKRCLNHKSKLSANLLKLYKNGSSNDVKIILQDGEICANKDILSCQSKYFATTFSNMDFIEGKSREVSLYQFDKITLEPVIEYLFSGEMDLKRFKLEILLDMMHVSRYLDIDDELFNEIETYIKHKISMGISSMDYMNEVINGFCAIERYKIENLRQDFICDIYFCLAVFDKFMESSIQSFQNFTVDMIKEVILFKYDPEVHRPLEDHFPHPTAKDRFEAFLSWYSKNDQDCSDNDKQLILDSFDLDDFTGKDLMTVVKTSGMFSEESVNASIIEKFDRCSCHLFSRRNDNWDDEYDEEWGP